VITVPITPAVAVDAEPPAPDGRVEYTVAVSVRRLYTDGPRYVLKAE